MAPPTSKDALLSEDPTSRRIKKYTDEKATMSSDSDSDFEGADVPLTKGGATKMKTREVRPKGKKGGYNVNVDVGGGKKKKGTITVAAIMAGVLGALTVIALVAGKFGFGPFAYWNLKGLPHGYGYKTEWWGPSRKFNLFNLCSLCDL
jgi:hypothetical protein